MAAAEQQALAARGADAHAALLFHPPRFKQLRAYNGHWNDDREIRLARAPLLPAPKNANQPPGWQRFLSDAARADVAALGRFFYLTWAARPADPQYLVAVWSPNLANEVPLPELDFIVFFSPTTAKYVPAYPYGLDKGTGIKQPYLDLGVKYLVNEYFYVHPLIARRNRAILVMPLCRRGDWGPPGTGEGLLRLLREVALFLHREGRTSRLGNAQIDSRPDLLCGASVRDQRIPIRDPHRADVPAPGAVAIGGFSSGIAPVKAVMSRWDVGLPSTLWGVRPTPERQGPRDSWKRAFRELWDLDGFHPGTGGWPSFLTALSDWYSADNRRRVFLYHCQDTVPLDPKTDQHPFWRALQREGTTVDTVIPSTPGRGWATELAGQRWAILRLANNYISGGPRAETPPLSDDAHHNVPKVAFSHAAAVTTVGVAPRK
jgi:hypothetical protein